MEESLQLCDLILEASPRHPDALHLRGVIAHFYGRLDLAIDCLREACLSPHAQASYHSNLAEMCRQKGLLSEGEEHGTRAITLDPTSAMAWNNLGILQQEAGKLEESLDSLGRAITIMPQQAEGYNNLGNTHRRLGQLDEAMKCYGQAIAFNSLYAEAHSNLAFLLNALGDQEQARKEALRAIELNPRLIDAYRNMAEIEASCLRYGDALRWLDALFAFSPRNPSGLAAQAMILKRADHLDKAAEVAHQAIALAPDSAEVHNVLGQIRQAQGRDEDALKHFEKAALLPGIYAEEAMVNQALLLMETGRTSDAIEMFLRVRNAFPRSILALVGLANFKTYEANDPDIGILESRLSENGHLTLSDRISIHFALGKAYLDSNNPDRAFHHLHIGNGLKRGTFFYDPLASDKLFDSIATTFNREYFDAHPVSRELSSMPIFVFGMPRSGTTLIEQILASHPLVHGAGELSALRHVIERAGHYPEAMDGLSEDDMTRLGQDYLVGVAPLAADRPFLVDKMPANFLYAGLITKILPGARLIHCRRDAVDTCLSCYTKQFSGEQLFSYNLTELGQFHKAYEALMTHWRQVLPSDRFIEVDYENVVDDLEGVTRKLLDFLGLPWSNDCLRFHDNRRPVRTASASQVRQPIYSSSKGRWHRYSQYLTPLLVALKHEAP